MSQQRIFVTSLSNVRPHPNADKLDLAECGGWQVIVWRGKYQSGDCVAFIEPGLVLKPHVADALGVTKYLREKVDIRGDRVLVVDKTRLRGEPSFGIVAPQPLGSIEGDDVTDHFEASKFEPPVKQNVLMGNAAPEDLRFPRYTDLENMRTYSNVLLQNEEVVVLEKIHGTNSRIGFVRNPETGEAVFKAGSRRLIRKLGDQNEITSDELEKRQLTAMDELYWRPFNIAAVREFLEFCSVFPHYKSVILYGEIYGPGIQNMDYGSDKIRYVAFDISINGKFLGYMDFLEIAMVYNIPTVPLITKGLFGELNVADLADGKTALWHGREGEEHIKEGVVVKPLIERNDPKVGRAILKYVSDAYLFSKNAEVETTDA